MLVVVVRALAVDIVVLRAQPLARKWPLKSTGRAHGRKGKGSNRTRTRHTERRGRAVPGVLRGATRTARPSIAVAFVGGVDLAIHRTEPFGKTA